MIIKLDIRMKAVVGSLCFSIWRLLEAGAGLNIKDFYLDG